MKNYDEAAVPELTRLAEEWSKKYADHYDPSEEECIGMALAFHFQWDISAICRCFGEALEDANAHKEAAITREWAG